MLAKYDSNVRAAIYFLRLLGVNVNNSTVNETLQNHPNWPSLLCISDSFTKWDIPNASGKIDKTEIDQLPVPFMGFLNTEKRAFVLVTQVTDFEVWYILDKYNKPIREKKVDFLNKWNGVYLVCETNANSGEKNFKKVKRKSIINGLQKIGFLSLLSGFLAYNLMVKANGLNAITALGIWLQFIFLLTGSLVTILLLWYEVDKENPFLRKVCTGFAKTNCGAILSGPQSKLFNWLSWSEIGFIYFTGGLLTLSLSRDLLSTTVSLIGWLGIAAIPYSFFSIWYQWRVAKQWCALCLCVQFLIIASAVNVLGTRILQPPLNLTTSNLIRPVIFYVLAGMGWLSIKPYLKKLYQTKNLKREYFRTKYNFEIFETLLQKQPRLSITPEGLGIDIGNKHASNTLIKICNPYCGPCAYEHPKIEELLDSVNNLHVKIIFNVPDDENNALSKPVRHLMAIAAENDMVTTKKALDDWYLPKDKDYTIFANKYPRQHELFNQGEKLKKMEKWCKQMKITATPTFFYNGFQLPDSYEIEDLKYFLLE